MEGEVSPSEKMAMELLKSDLDLLDDFKYDKAFLIPSSMATLIAVAKSFPLQISSDDYQNLKLSVIGKIDILEKFEARAAKEQCLTFKENLLLLDKIEDKKIGENKSHENNGSQTPTQTFDTE